MGVCVPGGSGDEPVLRRNGGTAGEVRLVFAELRGAYLAGGEQEAECRWYLEKYLTKSPFETSRAKDAAEELSMYAKSLFDQLHLGFLDSPWLTDTRTALYGLVIAATWQMSGFCMAMFLAGLRSIPEELREAAQVDGANGVQAFWYVVLPLLRPVTLSAIIVLGHISLKIFDLVFVMTFGGPGFSTDMPGLFMFRATFQQNLYARGAAISTVLLLMVAVLIVPYLIWSMRQEVER